MVAVAREALRKYGYLRRRLLFWPRSPNPSAVVTLCLNLRGRFAPRTVADMLCALYALSPPNSVTMETFRRSDRPSMRPGLSLVWYGPAAVRLLDAIGWQTGKPSLDARLLAWQRWRAYRKASRASRFA